MNLMTSQAATMSSREISELTQSRHDSVKRTIERLASDGVVTLPPLVEVKNSSNQTVAEYHLEKRDCLIVVARLSPEFTAAVVDRWQELEGQQQIMIPQTLPEALRLAAELAEENEKQKEQLQLAAPKVEFVDNLVDRKTLMTATQVGQKHKISAVKLNRMLDELGGIYSKAVKRSRVFTQQWVDDGYGEMKQTDLGHSQALFTTKGEVRIAELLVSEGLV